MTTLDVDMASCGLRSRVFMTVVDAGGRRLPARPRDHGPRAPEGRSAAAGGRALPVAGDGTVLAGVDASGEDLPRDRLGELPA